jgi:hypothetical protein
MIWGSHDSEYEYGCLLGCSAVWTGGIRLPTLQSYRPDDGGSTDLWTVGKLTPPVHTALQPRRQPYSSSCKSATLQPSSVISTSSQP